MFDACVHVCNSQLMVVERCVCVCECVCVCVCVGWLIVKRDLDDRCFQKAVRFCEMTLGLVWSVRGIPRRSRGNI